MTVEERANKLFFSIDSMVDVIHRKTITEAITQALQDQIEDCAKIADEEAQDIGLYKAGQIWQHASKEIAKRIRALTSPTEEGREIER